MKKSKNAKTQNKSKLKIIVLSTLAAIVIIITGLQMWFNYYTLQRLEKFENQHLQNLIRDPIPQSNANAVVEPLSGKVYVPPAKLVLPPLPEVFAQGIKYSHQAKTADNNEIVQIASVAGQNYASSIINNADLSVESIFERVPEAQSCTRQVTIFVQPEIGSWSEGLELIKTGSLQDDRKYKMYLDPQCNFNKKEMTGYIKQIQSY